MRDDAVAEHVNDSTGSPGPFDRLNRELAASHEAGSYLPVLSFTSVVYGVTQRCRECCHWSLPLNPPYLGRDTPAGAALRFEEWLVYHAHIVQHQRLHRREILVS